MDPPTVNAEAVFVVQVAVEREQVPGRQWYIVNIPNPWPWFRHRHMAVLAERNAGDGAEGPSFEKG